MPGVAVTLTDIDGRKLRATVTGPDGTYRFTGLTAGTYRVVVNAPAGTRVTRQDTSGAANTSKVHPLLGYSEPIRLSAAERRLNLDAGFVQTVPQITGTPETPDGALAPTPIERKPAYSGTQALTGAALALMMLTAGWAILWRRKRRTPSHPFVR